MKHVSEILHNLSQRQRDAAIKYRMAEMCREVISDCETDISEYSAKDVARDAAQKFEQIVADEWGM